MRRKALIFGLCLWGVACTLLAKDKKNLPLYKDAELSVIAAATN